MKKTSTKKSRVHLSDSSKNQGLGFSVAKGNFIDDTDEAFNGGITLDLTSIRKE